MNKKITIAVTPYQFSDTLYICSICSNDIINSLPTFRLIKDEYIIKDTAARLINIANRVNKVNFHEFTSEDFEINFVQ